MNFLKTISKRPLSFLRFNLSLHKTRSLADAANPKANASSNGKIEIPVILQQIFAITVPICVFVLAAVKYEAYETKEDLKVKRMAKD